MATINKNKLNYIQKLYESGLSAREIAADLNVSLDSIYYFFRKNNIKRRSAKENNQLQFQRKTPTFQVKKNLNESEKILKTAGIMLYWAEGSKWQNEKIVDFTNSDIKMVKMFLMFLRRICQIDEKKLRAYLYCYSNQDVDDLIKYWSGVTNIPIQQFTKPYIRKDYKSEKKGKMKFGMIHVRYGDKKLLILIKDWIKEFARKI